MFVSLTGGGRRPPLSESPPVVTARRRRFKLAWANSEPNARNVVAEENEVEEGAFDSAA